MFVCAVVCCCLLDWCLLCVAMCLWFVAVRCGCVSFVFLLLDVFCLVLCVWCLCVDHNFDVRHCFMLVVCCFLLTDVYCHLLSVMHIECCCLSLHVVVCPLSSSVV